MLKMLDDDVAPRDAAGLVTVTRENGRCFADYDAILARLSLPSPSSFDALNILEIGTGVGSALAGALQRFGPDAHIASLDINAPVLRAISARGGLPVRHVTEIVRRDLRERPAIDLLAASIEDASLPEGYFDLAYSVWVLYQVADKIAAIANILRSLRSGAALLVVGAGSICTTPRPLSPETLRDARHFVWTHRASRFSWLNGTRELSHFLEQGGHPFRVESLDAFLTRRCRLEPLPAPEHAEFPAASFVIRKPENLKPWLAQIASVQLSGSVSTKNSAIIPIYTDEYFE